ncbi:MAG TPA: class I SAM-dependent methyltransferase [Terriglobales bacterium]|nr:class I SAM-dependent methyltransferase [Terriglobales bacterium]
MYNSAVKLSYAFLRSKYRRHRFDACFNWEWQKTNYNRIALVNLLVSTKRNATYLEIGCQSNDLFDSVFCSRKVGVDPRSGGTVRATSDDFFESNKQLFDVVFIDGLHTYDQVRRDVINSIRFLKPGGFVALHDMLPGSWLEHHVPRISDAWTGDVWKVAFELSSSTGIDFKIVKVDHGVGVFRTAGETPELLDLRKELGEKQFEYLYRNIGRLPLLDWHEFVKWLG